MTKIQIKSIFGDVIFEYECENNTIKKTIEKAIKEKKSLSYSNLRGSNLSYSNLSGSDLRGSDLRGSNLRGSDLSYSDLSGSDLRGSKNKKNAYLPIFCKWSHSILGDKIQIGCKIKTIQEWDCFFESEGIYSTERKTQEFKQIQAVFLAYKSYLTHLKS